MPKENKLLISYDRCKTHDVPLQDYNGWGQKYSQPVCLECRWEQGRTDRIRVERPRQSFRGFLQHFGLETVRIRQTLRRRLQRLLEKDLGRGVHRWELEQLAPAAGNGAAQVISRLRRFELRGKRKQAG